MMKQTLSLLLATVLSLIGYTTPVIALDGYLTPESIQEMRDTRKRGDDPTELCEKSCEDFEKSCKEISKDAEKACKNYKDEEKTCKASCDKDKACEKTCDSYYKQWEKLCKQDVKDWEKECKDAAKDCKDSCNQSFVFVLLSADSSIPVIDLTATELGSLSINIIINFTAQHIADLPIKAMQGFKPEQVRALPPQSLEVLSPDQAKALPEESRKAFSTEQIKYMSEETVKVLTFDSDDASDAAAGDDDNGKNDKVTICQMGKEITVSESAVPALLNQGATLGKCEAPVACTLEYMPVCGESQNGAPKTYGNMCNLEAEKAKLLYEGECKLDTVDEPGNPTTTKPDVVDEDGNPVTGDDNGDIIIDMPKPLKLFGFVRDLPADHTDVEVSTTGVQEGCVKTELDAEFMLPVSVADNACNITSLEEWYISEKSMPYALELEYEAESRAYSVSLNEFFPIDDKLLGNEGRAHNYHFTYETHAKFTSESGQSLTVGSDDDLWVFLDGKLIIDLGGVHAFAEETIEFDELGLVSGQEYKLSFFYAERRTSDAHLSVSTNIPLQSLMMDKPACEEGDENCEPPPCEEGDDCDKPACEEGDENCEAPPPCEEGDDCDKPACEEGDENCEVPPPCEEGDDCDKPACEEGDENCEPPLPCKEGDDCDSTEQPSIEEIDFANLTVELVAKFSLNIIVKLTAEKIAQMPVDAIAGFDEQQIAYIPPKACEGLTDRHIEKVKPQAARGFQKAQIKYVKPKAAKGFKYQHIEYFKRETVSGFSVEQIENIDKEELAGFTPENIGGLATEVVEEKGVEILQTLEESKLPRIPQQDVTWILLNTKTQPAALPQPILISFNISIHPETGRFQLPAGKLRLPPIKKPLLTVPESVELPEIPDFNSSPNIMGLDQTVIEQVNKTFVNMNFSQFTSSQSNGIFEVAGAGELADVKFNFIPDEDGFETVEQGTPEGITIDKGGRVILVTSTGLKTRLLPAPRNPEHVMKVIKGGSMKVNKRGITRLQVPKLGRTIFGVFDSALEVAEAGAAVGVTITGSRGIDEKAEIVYEDGFKQTIRPAIADLDLLISAREGLIDATRYGKYFMHSDGKIYMVYGNQLGRVVPTFDVAVNVDVSVTVPTIMPAGDDDELAVLVMPDGEQQTFAYQIIGNADDYEDFAESDE